MKILSDNLFSKEWCDLVFEHKNKAYGAFVHRKDMPKNIIFGFFVGVTTTLLLLFALSVTFMVPELEEMDFTFETNVLSQIKLEEQNTDKEIAKKSEPIKSEKKADDITNSNIEATSSKTENLLKFADSLDQKKDSLKIDTLDKQKAVISANGKDKDLSLGNSDTSKITKLYYTRDAQFPGGIKELEKYITRNLTRPKEAGDIHGTVWIYFIVDIKGFVTNVEVLKSLHPALDKEALRVVSNMPQWRCAMNHSIPQRRPMKIPINF